MSVCVSVCVSVSVSVSVCVCERVCVCEQSFSGGFLKRLETQFFWICV